jgi:hypothetical protein
MEDLTFYLNFIRKKLEEQMLIVPLEVLMEEITNVATENWINTGVPNLNDEQINKVILRALARGITLN